MGRRRSFLLLPKLHLAKNSIKYGGASLGPATALLVEFGELKRLGLADGVTHSTLPMHIDMIFAAGSRLVVVESKRVGDFLSSWSSGRLSRQIATLLNTGHVPLLLLRWEGNTVPDLEPPTRPGRPTWWSDLARYQQLGVTVVVGPTDDSIVLRFLAALRPVLAGGRNPLAALKRTDQHPKPQSFTSGWFLENIKGVGPVLAGRLYKKFGSTSAALSASIEEWRGLKIPESTIKRWQEAIK